ncbi:hypothetical protein EHS25_002675 [Saitozyma podzolica]|uniref:Uncharacterized protein n=1 Tax=Saitozyma podzolica TaxID=1890683 RepID=A0A427YD73_9TREE|nr:hypothetical protein EHS25_002675 [Saitozyma podzolica]
MIVDFPSIVRVASSLVLLGDVFIPTGANPPSNSGANVFSPVLNSSGDANDLSTAGGRVAALQRSAIYLAKAMPPPSVSLPATFSVLFLVAIFATIAFRLNVKYDARYKSLSLAHDVTIAFLVNAVFAGIATAVSGQLSPSHLPAEPSQVLRVYTLFQLAHTETPMLRLGISELLTVLVLLEAIFLTRDFIAESGLALSSANGEISLNDEPAPCAFDEKIRLGAEQV